MPIQRYSINQHPIEALLTWIKSDEIAIPEIQRPFVWNAAKVRDFIDSLYNGYPVGYLIAWRNPDVRLKDGTQSTGKRILIDGQQRVMALFCRFAWGAGCQPKTTSGHGYLSPFILARSVLKWQTPPYAGIGDGLPTYPLSSLPMREYVN